MFLRSVSGPPAVMEALTLAIPVVKGGGLGVICHFQKWVQRRLLCEDLGCVWQKERNGRSDLLLVWLCLGSTRGGHS